MGRKLRKTKNNIKPKTRAKNFHRKPRRSDFSTTRIGVKISDRIIDILTFTKINVKASKKSLAPLADGTVFHINGMEIKELIGNINSANNDEIISTLSYGYDPLLATLQTLDDVSVLPNKLQNQDDYKINFKDRKDLTHLPFLTIDPDDAKDHDDAIYFDEEKYCLYVAIADVSEFVSSGTKIDEIARKRLFSLYFPNFSYPMLPPILSSNLCSLKAQKLRLAMTFAIEIDKNFEIKDFKLMQSIIKVRQNITYNEALGVIENKNIKLDEIEKKSIVALHHLAANLRTRRLKYGFDFDRGEVNLHIASDGELLGVEIKHQTKSHQLVEEAMLLANICAAKLQKKHTKIGIYRIHPKISVASKNRLNSEILSLGINVKNLSKLNDEEFHNVILNLQKSTDKKLLDSLNYAVIRSFEMAIYNPAARLHFGLGFMEYAHFTSPIRRYSDLLLHRILKSIITNDKENLASSAMDAQIMCDTISQIERTINKITHNYNDRKFARFACQNLGVKLSARVVNMDSDILCKAQMIINGALLCVEKISSTAKMELKNLSVNDEVLVRIIGANIIEGRIFAELLKIIKIK